MELKLTEDEVKEFLGRQEEIAEALIRPDGDPSALAIVLGLLNLCGDWLTLRGRVKELEKYDADVEFHVMQSRELAAQFEEKNEKLLVERDLLHEALAQDKKELWLKLKNERARICDFTSEIKYIQGKRAALRVAYDLKVKQCGKKTTRIRELEDSIRPEAIARAERLLQKNKELQAICDEQAKEIAAVECLNEESCPAVERLSKALADSLCRGPHRQTCAHWRALHGGSRDTWCPPCLERAKRARKSSRLMFGDPVERIVTGEEVCVECSQQCHHAPDCSVPKKRAKREEG